MSDPIGGAGAPLKPMDTDPPPDRALAARARALWESMAGTPGGFASTLAVQESPRSAICPRGWVGIAVIDGMVLATAPDHRTARLVAEAFGGTPAASLTDPEVLRDRLPVVEILGPATLAYLDPVDFKPERSANATPLPAHHAGLRDLLLTAGPDDAGESGIDQITSQACVVQEGDRVVAAAGYRDWPCSTAHLSVLTAPDARGRGLARAVASAAVAEAIEAGMLPQWRARSRASRSVARALGFRELGSQVSIRLAADI